MKQLYVGIGEYAVATNEAVLQTVLGSCVGVIVFDKVNRVGGLAHIYMPDSSIARLTKHEKGTTLLDNAPKYADILIPSMLRKMEKYGADHRYLVAYLVGGASIFEYPDDSSLNVGTRNLERARSLLKQENIGFLEVKVGGNTGRKVIFDCGSGDITVTEFKSE